MKILEINTFNKVVGGVESYVAGMAAQLQARGHRLVPLYLMPEEDHPGLVSGHRGYYLHDLTPHHTDQILHTIQNGRAGEIRRRFRQILDVEKPDLIHCNNIYSPLFIREVQNRVPVVRTVHDYRFLCPRLLKLTVRHNVICEHPMGLACYRERCLNPLSHHDLRHLLLLRWEREVHRDFDHIVVKSEHMKRQLVQAGFSPDQVEVIPLSIDLPEQPLSELLEERDGPPIVLFVGRVAEEKGLDILIRAMARIHSDAVLQVCGDGPATPTLQDLVEQLGLRARVDWLGWQDVEQLRRRYRRCHLCVVPSTWPEPFGLVGLEAMAHARPVIGSDVGGIPEWLDHEHSGLLVPPREVEALTQALERLLFDAELRRQLGQNGRREVETRFRMDIAAGKLLHVFEHHRRL